MPVISSDYHPPRFLRNTHFHTIACATLRKRPRLQTIRERIETDDGDFLDLDWLETTSRSLVIITHGMEGSTQSKYVLHTMAHATENGFSALAWNMRGCSGEPNRKLHFYHSGKTEDLHQVVRHAIKRGFKKIYLAGFSLGGNLQLLYLAQRHENLPRQIKSAVSVSAPVDLLGAEIQIARKENKIYLKRFLNDFKNKFETKRKKRGMYIDTAQFSREIKTLACLDRKFTAPWNGFANEKVYYEQCSSLPHLKKINIPCLLLNAKDDSFLSDTCYPFTIASNSKFFHLEAPDHGGHCAMLLDGKMSASHMERRIVEFFRAD